MEQMKLLIDDDNFKIPRKYYAKSNNNINLDWMNNKAGYEDTAEEVDSDYMKGNNNNELKLIKKFITKINNGTINNKNKARNGFKKLKQKVTGDILKRDIIKDLEKYMFGEDIERLNQKKNMKKV